MDPTTPPGAPSPAPPAGGPGGSSNNGPSGSRTVGTDRVPPNHLDAEVAVLGAALLSRAALAEVVEIVRPEDFYRSSHRDIFETITMLFAGGDVVDPITVVERLDRTGKLTDVGGASAIHDLVAAVPTAANAVYHARIVAEKAMLRRLIDAGTEVVKLGFDAGEDVSLAIDRAEQLIYDVAQGRISSEYAPLKELLSEGFERIEQRFENRSEVTGLPTGFNDLDRLTAGLQRQNLIVLAARPSMGKSSMALNIAQYVTVELQKQAVVFSLEMSKAEIVDRLLSSEARVDSFKIRNGRLDDADWASLSDAMGRLAEAPLFIDDTAAITLMEIRAKCRRLKQREGLELVIVDYLQLMHSHRRAENRVQEVSEISRGLKMIAKELDVPVMALSQLSRQPESRTDKRPQLSDLRESGCLTGDTRLLRADTGEAVTMRELHDSGERDIPVWTLDDRFRMVRGTMTNVFSSGVKRTFELKLRSGRTVKASANHPFLTFDGWRALEDIAVGERLAVPRRIAAPDMAREIDEDELVLLAHLIGDGCVVSRQPLHYTSADAENLRVVEEAARRRFGIDARRVPQDGFEHTYLRAPHHLTHGRGNPISEWLSRFGLYGKRSHEKFIPPFVFGLSTGRLATFLRHLWATDGSVTVRKVGTRKQVRIYYATTSRRLARDVQLALLRFGINARLRTVGQGQHRDGYTVDVSGADEQRVFLDRIGVAGERGARVLEARAALDGVTHNPNVDTIPLAVWDEVRRLRDSSPFTERAFQAALGMQYCGTPLYQSNLSRARLGRVAAVLDDVALGDLATSDVLWDEVVTIEPLGEEEVFDATVPGTHNFVADGIVAHNSIEQDADIVGFIYRDEVYDPETPDRGVAELIISKHRNGPIGVVKLAFLDHLTKFANLARTSV